MTAKTKLIIELILLILVALVSITYPLWKEYFSLHTRIILTFPIFLTLIYMQVVMIIKYIKYFKNK
jgi:hypothetical protein